MNTKRGFSLIEVIIVLAILGTIAGVTVPAYRNLEGRGTLDEAAQEIQSLFSRARQIALQSGMDVKVLLNQSEHRYWIQRDSMGLVKDLNAGVLAVPSSVGWLPDQPRLNWLFHSNGRVDGEPITLSSAGSSVRIHLNRWTGETLVTRSGAGQ